MSTRRSTSASRKATPKDATTAAPSKRNAAESIKPVVVTENPVVDAGPELRKQELLDKVVTRAEVKKKLAKPVVEAVLEILGEALAEGREMNLQPLGKVKLNRIRDMAHARVIVTKIRQSKTGGANVVSALDGDDDTGVKDQVAPGAD